MSFYSDKRIFRAIQLAAVTVLLGRAYQHWFWDAPYRALFWDENWMSGIVTFVTSMTWKEFVTSPESNVFIQSIIKATGIIYVVGALIAVFIKKLPRHFQYFLIFCSLNLIFLAVLYTKEKFFHLGQFFEYSLQFSAPILLYLFVNQLLKESHVKLIKMGIALTFLCHGLYAVGYYPRPESFLYMTMNILGVNQDTAIMLLNVAGILDFIIAAGLFFSNKIVKPLIIYAAFWGLVTSLARVWANFYPEFWTETLHQWTHETVMRLPHFLIPLALIFILFRNQIAKISAN